MLGVIHFCLNTYLSLTFNLQACRQHGGRRQAPAHLTNFRQSHFYLISPVLHGNVCLDIWPYTNSIYKAYTHWLYRKTNTLSFHSHPLILQHSLRYAYVQVVYLSTFLQLLFLIFFLNTISNILLIFNYSIYCLWIVCCQGSIWDKFDHFYFCFDLSPITPLWTDFIHQFAVTAMLKVHHITEGSLNNLNTQRLSYLFARKRNRKVFIHNFC